MSFSLRSTAIATCLLLALLVPAQAGNTSRSQSDSFAKKLAIIQQHAEESPKSARRTTVTEVELNSWFIYRAPALLPAGVKDPQVTAIGNGKLHGVVNVDLDALGQSNAWKLLAGKVPIALTGILRTKGGRGQFELQSAQLSGVPVPKFVVQEIVTHYTRSSERPKGIRLDNPFELPASIKQIDVGSGQAVITQ